MNRNAEDGHIALRETATVFCVEKDSVVGVLHDSGQPERTGVLLIVGGRQYRTGAQRQFVRLARHLAANGFSVFRFDVRGMGDSAAEQHHFLDTAADISAAISEFRRLAPQVRRVILWGLCDGASAAIYYASRHSDADIDGVMMVNPWITTEGGAARATLKHYYRKRISSVDFWRKLFRGDVDLLRSFYSLGSIFNCIFQKTFRGKAYEYELPDIVFTAIERFCGDVSILISEKDLTGKEFKDEFASRYANSCTTMRSVTMMDVEADHTFSTPMQHCCLEYLTLEWCRQYQA